MYRIYIHSIPLSNVSIPYTTRAGIFPNSNLVTTERRVLVCDGISLNSTNKYQFEMYRLLEIYTFSVATKTLQRQEQCAMRAKAT